MSRAKGDQHFKRNDVKRAIKSAQDTGMSVECVEVVCKNGTIIRVMGRKPGDMANESGNSNEVENWISEHEHQG